MQATNKIISHVLRKVRSCLFVVKSSAICLNCKHTNSWPYVFAHAKYQYVSICSYVILQSCTLGISAKHNKGFTRKCSDIPALSKSSALSLQELKYSCEVKLEILPVPCRMHRWQIDSSSSQACCLLSLQISICHKCVQTHQLQVGQLQPKNIPWCPTDWPMLLSAAAAPQVLLFAAQMCAATVVVSSDACSGSLCFDNSQASIRAMRQLSSTGLTALPCVPLPIRLMSGLCSVLCVAANTTHNHAWSIVVVRSAVCLPGE